ncbi:hypothetical protein M569_16453, partial [Genlisea aurea]
MENRREESAAPRAEELLKKIQELELGHAHLKQEMSKLVNSSIDRRRRKQRSQSVSPPKYGGGDGGPPVGKLRKGSVSFRHSSSLQRDGGGGSSSSSSTRANWSAGEGGRGPAAAQFTDKQYLNILQSMGNAVHIFDLNSRIIYWNKSAENLYGYSSEEALGRDPVELLTDRRHLNLARNIMNHLRMGKSWTGQFPVKHKRGEQFLIAATNTPFYDEDDGTLVGVICVSSDPRAYQETNHVMNSSQTMPPCQVAIASKISNLAARVSCSVKLKLKPTESNNVNYYSASVSEDAASSDASTPPGNSRATCYGVGRSHEEGDENDTKVGISKIFASKAEAWIVKKGLVWPWKGGSGDGTESKSSRFVWPWMHNESGQLKEVGSGFKSEINVVDSRSWSPSVNRNSTGSVSSSGSATSYNTPNNKIDVDNDYEISWDELTIGEQIGQGSCGTVYHALWYGSDVAVKVFSRKEYSDDAISSFRQEVSLMKRLRHPNILLFMGAVTSPERLCIVTEFLPRGSLFRLLQRNTSRLDWRRQTQMALDVARGMNYLHHCNPPIVHRDLKSSNLLVDKNWTVKVSDFGLSRLKDETYVTTKTGRGTPQWMAPEVLRNEAGDEKADVYSYGVILWEIATHKIPWENLNTVQLIGAVGFMNQRLEIPDDVDPRWGSLMESCFH